MKATVNEDSAVRTRWTFSDFDNQLTTPLEVRYSVVDKRTGKVLIDWTTVTPANPLTIIVSAVAQEIQNRGLSTEDREMVVQTDYNDALTRQSYKKRYVVRNLRGID